MVCLEEYQSPEDPHPTKEEWQQPERIPTWQLAVFFIGMFLMLCGGVFVATHEQVITAVNSSN